MDACSFRRGTFTRPDAHDARYNLARVYGKQVSSHSKAGKDVGAWRSRRTERGLVDEIVLDVSKFVV
jgi:hypothetical protein